MRIIRTVALVTIAIGWSALSCGGGKQRPNGDGSVDSGSPDGGSATCLDQPGGLLPAPQGRLPCELIPPGVRL
jgi:hypothetical protein